MKQQDIRAILAEDKALQAFVQENLRHSLSSIGFSDFLITTLVDGLGTIDIPKFRDNFSEELETLYQINFFQKIVPEYFAKYIISHLPDVGSVLDVGCGTGILCHTLGQTGKFKNVLGIDLIEYPEWKIFSSENVTLRVIDEHQFEPYVTAYKPEAVILTWTLHHMRFTEQERYLRAIHHMLPNEALVVLLEDSYAETAPAENGQHIMMDFSRLSAKQRQNAMSVYDWVANKVLAGREKVSMPCTYRTLEQWERLAKQICFSVHTKRFVGFPERRDINTPQSLLVLQKKGPAP